MSSIQHKFIEFCIESNVLRFGEFKTKAGRLSPYFFNAGLFNTGAMLSKLADFYARTLIKAMEDGRIECDMIFGPAYKGITLAAAVAMRMAELGYDLPFAYNRKEVKDHGEGGSIVGYKPKDGDRVIIIEDVITAGTAVRETMPVLASCADVMVTDMFISVNRCEFGQNPEKTAIMEVEEEFGIRVHALVTVYDIHEYLLSRPDYAHLVPLMEDYMHKYCLAN